MILGADYEGVGITAAVGDRQWQGADITQWESDRADMVPRVLTFQSHIDILNNSSQTFTLHYTMSDLWYGTIWNSKMKMKIREFPYLCIAQWIGSVIFNFQQNLVNFGNEVRNKMFSPRLMLMVSNKCFQIRLFITVLAGLLVTKCNPHYMLWSPWRWLCWLRWWRWAGQRRPHPSTSGRHPSYCPGHCSCYCYLIAHSLFSFF